MSQAKSVEPAKKEAPVDLTPVKALTTTPVLVVNKKPTMEEQRLKDREKVEGIFRFYEVPGGMMSFSFKAYKGDPVERFDMQDGKIYTIPLGVAKHLNKNGWYPEYSYMAGEDNLKMGFAPDGYKLNPGSAPLMRITKKVRRFGFQSLEFLDPQDYNPKAASVSSAEFVQMGSVSL